MKRRASNELDSRRAEEPSTGRSVAMQVERDDLVDTNSFLDASGEDSIQIEVDVESICSQVDGVVAVDAELDATPVGAGEIVTPKGLTDNPYVCYGMLYDINCQLLESAKGYDATQLSRNLVSEDYVLLHFGIQSKRCIISDVKDSPLFQINAKVSRAIIKASESCELHFDPYAKHEDILHAINGSLGKNAKMVTLRLHANVYGPKVEIQAAGTLLSANGIFLQEPLWQAPDKSYHNPHMIKFDYISESDIWLAELTLSANIKAQFAAKHQLTLVLDDLPQHHSHIDLSENKCIRSPLYRHQEEACAYMVKREIGDLEASMKLWSLEANDDGVPIYRHKVTLAETFELPPEPQGGILADDMGLGKTLSAISLITNSMSRASIFAAQSQAVDSVVQPSLARTKATLVVVPSLLLTQDWIKEIKRRTVPGTLRVARYHGHERSKHFSDLLDFDIVLTTYGTVTTEYRKSYNRGREVLYYLQWFRIILDEAHTIRSQTTRQFNAILNLHAHHHWCLSGTPISNRIEDVGALLRFCRVPLLQDPSCFHKNVTQVAKRSFSQGCRVLRQVLAPICLRRTKSLLDIPPPQMVETLVEFTAPELQRYRDVEAYSRRLLISSSTSRKAGKGGHTMLQAILRLRICCNLGTNMRITDADAEDHLDPDEAWTLLEEKGEAVCASCSSQVRLINQLDDQSSGTLGTCMHVLCGSCKTMESDPQDLSKSYVCPACNKQVSQQTLPLSNTDHRNTAAKELTSSAKIQKLVEDLLETHHGHKSIVFSAWRKTLDIASEACQMAGIAHVRIDGCTPQPDRRLALDTFTTSPTMPVLLITFGTGALGLNLAAATRIHVLEPQWNPSVEEQAIGRAVRIGQEKNATIVRYIVRDTIEQQIQSYQRRKINLAAGGFGDDEQPSEHESKLSAKWLYTC